jgi:hypothetical protein
MKGPEHPEEAAHLSELNEKQKSDMRSTKKVSTPTTLREMEDYEFVVDTDRELRKEWEESIRGAAIQITCNKCGASMASTCECSYQRWKAERTVASPASVVSRSTFCVHCGTKVVGPFCGGCGKSTIN